MPSKPKKIINDAKDSVEEFIAGLLLQFPNHMVKLENHNVVLAAKRKSGCVQLISGGGSGHEPSHAGWLGDGMLSGAVCGGIFASPSVSSVLAAIRAVSASTEEESCSGVLLVIKNYTGDRLNFGMAAERAAQEGIPVEFVVVSDDCALPREKGITGARGVAGTVLIHKIAGAAAAAGKKSLSEVAALARLVNSRMGTLGVALDSVTVPGADAVNDRLDDKTIEIGLGIHGEAGMKQSPLLSANEIAKEMITTIRTFGRVVANADDGTESVVPLFESGDEVVALINNLGGTSNFEMSILARTCVVQLEKDFGVKVTRVLVGSYMTSFDMHGASLTILNVEGQSELLELLDAPTTAPAWTACDVWDTTASDTNKRPSDTPVPEVVVKKERTLETTKKPPLAVDNFDAAAKAALTAAVQKLAESEPLLTKYDTIVGDGDCGITMKRGATEVLERLDKGTIPTDHPVTMFAALADAVSASMGGTSGILLELMFRKISSTLSRCEGKIAAADMCGAIQAGVDAIGLYGGAKVGARTMLDALVPAAAELVATSGDMKQAAEKAKAGADGTASMKSASAGRSNYLSEDTLKDTPDPGAIAVSIVFQAVAQQ